MRQRSDLYFRITLFESANSITSCNKYTVKLGHWTRSSNPSWNPMFTSMPRFRKRGLAASISYHVSLYVCISFLCVETITRIFLWRISEIHRFEARSSAKGNIADPVSEMSQTTEFTCASLSQPGTPNVSSNPEFSKTYANSIRGVADRARCRYRRTACINARVISVRLTGELKRRTRRTGFRDGSRSPICREKIDSRRRREALVGSVQAFHRKNAARAGTTCCLR